MNDKPNEPPVIEIIPGRAGEISAIASASAPFLYFDGAPNYGFYGGIANVTLEAIRHTSSAGSVWKDRVIVAHLRMSLEAAESLKAALEGVLLLAAKPEGAPH
jgi:hypothetical protein